MNQAKKLKNLIPLPTLKEKLLEGDELEVEVEMELDDDDFEYMDAEDEAQKKIDAYANVTNTDVHLILRPAVPPPLPKIPGPPPLPTVKKAAKSVESSPPRTAVKIADQAKKTILPPPMQVVKVNRPVQVEPTIHKPAPVQPPEKQQPILQKPVLGKKNSTYQKATIEDSENEIEILNYIKKTAGEPAFKILARASTLYSDNIAA